MKTRDRYLSIFLLGVLMGAFGPMTGCGGHRSGERAKTEASTATSGSPYVEAYIEYTGPNARWAGPPSLLIHVDAREAGVAKFQVTPSLSGQAAPAEGAAVSRTLAAAKPNSEHGISSEVTRESLEAIGAAMQAPEVPFAGCLSPVHVRLIRADGTLLERRGCRSEGGWTGVASRSVSGFLESVVKSNEI